MNFKKLVSSISMLELALIEVLIFGVIWLADEYMGVLITVIISTIAFAILIISLIVELIERSKISKKYFLTLFVIGLIPIIVGLGYAILNKGLDFEQW